MDIKIKNQGGLTDWQMKLKSKGWKYLGGGCFSEVYGHKNCDRVIKIVRRGDRAYNVFVNNIKESKNKYFPKIYKICRIIFIHNRTVLTEHDVYTLEKLQNRSEEHHKYMPKHFHTESTSKLSRATDELKTKIKAENKEAWEALNLIFKLEKTEKLCEDFGSHNILYRGNIPVLSDPLCA